MKRNCLLGLNAIANEALGQVVEFKVNLVLNSEQVLQFLLSSNNTNELSVSVGGTIGVITVRVGDGVLPLWVSSWRGIINVFTCIRQATVVDNFQNVETLFFANDAVETILDFCVDSPKIVLCVTHGSKEGQCLVILCCSRSSSAKVCFPILGISVEDSGLGIDISLLVHYIRTQVVEVGIASTTGGIHGT